MRIFGETMPAAFQSLALLLEKVKATKKRLEIINETANYLKRLDAQEVEAATNIMVGRAFPKHSQKTLDVSWSTLIRTLQRITGPDWVSCLRQAMTATGDIGSAVKIALEKTQTKRQTQLTQTPLTITEVQNTFEAIAQAKGTGSRTRKERLITALMSRAAPVEAKYLVKVFTGEMRTGLHEGLMEQAVARAFEIPLVRVQHAAMVLGDISEVAFALKSGGVVCLESVGFSVFRPVQLMLAQTAQSVKDALEEHGGKSAFEYKYDGARVQIHKQGDIVEVFSRRLSDVTASLPEVVEKVKKSIRAQSAIVEGEVIAFNNSGYPIAFQHLMRRFRRTRGVSDFAEKMPITLFLFDILYLNGDSQITKSYMERRQILAATAGTIDLSKQMVTDKLEQAEEFLRQALAAGHEGLMAKKLDGPYTPGRRGRRWLKVKTVLEPLDLVITAAEYGYGRRKDWLSDYYLAARDPESGEFLDIGKTFKGLIDAEIIELTRRLKESAVSGSTHKVVVIPKIVVEVAFNEIQQSPRYKSQMALRFARIIRIRDDKSPEEASAIGQVREIYDRQFRNKGKYTGSG
jgi:DNA ligase 1